MYVTTADVLEALSWDPTTKRVFLSFGINQDQILSKISDSLHSVSIIIQFPFHAEEERQLNPNAQEILRGAEEIAHNEHRQEIFPEDLLICMLKNPQSQAGRYLADFGLTEESIPQIKEAYQKLKQEPQLEENPAISALDELKLFIENPAIDSNEKLRAIRLIRRIVKLSQQPKEP
mgnify:FL=1